MKAMRAWPLLLLPILLPGCALQQAGKALGDGLMQAVNENSESVGKGLVKGAGEGLNEDVLNDVTRGKLTDTVISVEDAALRQLPSARDDLLGDRTQQQMKQLVELMLASMEEHTRRTSHALMVDAGRGLREEILNDKTREQLNLLLVELGKTARGQTNQMRDEMLGESSQKQVKILVDGAMGAVVEGTDKIRRQAHDELSFVQKNTAETLLVIGGLAAAVVLMAWRQREKNKLLLNLMARQLQEMADTPALASTLERLQHQAEQMGVRNQLEDALLLQGMITSKRKPRRKQRDNQN